jgi:hypothetical protein
MKYVRIYTRTDGESYFEDIEIPMKGSSPYFNPSPKDSIQRSEITKATGISFNEVSPRNGLGRLPYRPETSICSTP